MVVVVVVGGSSRNIYRLFVLPCLSKLSSLRMQTSAKNLLTSLRYNMLPLFNLIRLELALSNADVSIPSLGLSGPVTDKP